MYPLLGITSGSATAYAEKEADGSDLITSIIQAKLHDSEWGSLHPLVQAFRLRLEESSLSDSSLLTQQSSILDTLTATSYETLYHYLSKPDLDHIHLAYLDPLIRLYWDHLVRDRTSLAYAHRLVELIATSLSEGSSYNETEMESLSYALPVKGHPEFIKHVALAVPEPNPSHPVMPNSTNHDSDLSDIASRMIERLGEHIDRAESHVDVASMLSSALYVYDSMVSPGDEETAGEPLTSLCQQKSAFINDLVHDLTGAHTVRQRVALERFCLDSLSLKVRFVSLFLPYIQQSFMVSPYMRRRTRIRLESHLDDIEANLSALTRVSREELLAGDIVVEYPWSIFGFERVRSIDEESWIDGLIPKLVWDRQWFEGNLVPRADVRHPDLFVGAGKLIALGLIRERLSINGIHESILSRLLTRSDDDEFLEIEESNTSVNAFIHGIFSVIPRDAFIRFFYDENELEKVFSGKLYFASERGPL